MTNSSHLVLKGSFGSSDERVLGAKFENVTLDHDGTDVVVLQDRVLLDALQSVELAPLTRSSVDGRSRDKQNFTKATSTDDLLDDKVFQAQSQLEASALIQGAARLGVRFEAGRSVAASWIVGVVAVSGLFSWLPGFVEERELLYLGLQFVDEVHFVDW